MLRKRCASPKSTLFGGPRLPGRLNAFHFFVHQFSEVPSHATYKIALSALS